MNKEVDITEKPKKKLLFKLNPTSDLEQKDDENPKKSPVQLMLEEIRKEIRENEIKEKEYKRLYRERRKLGLCIPKVNENTKTQEYYKSAEYYKEYYRKNAKKFLESSKRYKNKIRTEGKLASYKKLEKF